MYTDDDKKSKFRYKSHNTRSNVSNNYNNNYNNSSYEEDYYKDYYDDYKVVESKKENIKYNKLNTSYYDSYNDDEYNYNQKSLTKKKYVVIIIILSIILISLIIILMRNLNVTKPPVGDNSNYVRLQENQIQLKVGNSKKLGLILSDTNSNYKIEWFSNDDSVAIVDENGNVKAINEGEAIILVAYYLKDKVYDAECHIYVSK